MNYNDKKLYGGEEIEFNASNHYGDPYPEEAFDEDIDDDLLRYTLIVEVECNWPKHHNCHVGYKMAMPLYFIEEDEDNVNIPYFNKNIEITGIDRLRDEVSVKLFLGKEIEETLKLNESVTHTFEFYNVPNTDKSYREGIITLTFVKHRFVYINFTGKIKVREQYINLTTGTTEADENYVFVNFGEKDQDTYYSEVTGKTFYPFLIDESGDFIILTNFVEDDVSGITIWDYYPVKIGEKNVYTDEWYEEDSNTKYRLITEVSFER